MADWAYDETRVHGPVPDPFLQGQLTLDGNAESSAWKSEWALHATCIPYVLTGGNEVALRDHQHAHKHENGPIDEFSAPSYSTSLPTLYQNKKRG